MASPLMLWSASSSQRQGLRLGRRPVKNWKNLVPRQMLKIAIQAAMVRKIIAVETVRRCVKKRVGEVPIWWWHFHGKRKAPRLSRKKAKKRMRQVGKRRSSQGGIYGFEAWLRLIASGERISRFHHNYRSLRLWEPDYEINCTSICN